MIKINGLEVTQIEGIPVYQLSRKEEGNTGHFRCLWQDKIQPFDIVTIEDEDGTHQFIVHSATKVQSSPNVIHYDVMLKDPIHIFDKLYIPDRRFTTFGGVTVSYILDVYRTNADATILFDYSFNPLLDLKMPEKEYAGVPFTIILKDLAKRIGSQARVLLREDGVPLISFVRLSERVGTTAIDYVPNHYQSNITAENYATEVLGKVKNAVVEDGRGTWFPSKTGGVTPRTDEFRFDEESAAYILQDKMWAIIKVIVPNGIRISNLDREPDDPIVISVDLDITHNVVPTALFNQLLDTTLANFDDPYERRQANVIRYDIKGDRIFGLWDKFEGLFNRQHFLNALRSARDRWVIENNWVDFIALNYTADDFIRDTPLKIKYVSQRDIDYIINKMNVTNKYQSTLLSNQLATLVELNQHANGLSALAERLANEEITFQESITRGDKPLYKLGQWTTDNKLITSVKREIDGNEVNQHVELSEKFANIDVPSQVSRTPYPFSVRSDVDVTTNFITQEYIEFSDIQRPIDSYMNETARRIAVNIFDYEEQYDNPIYDCEVRPFTNRFLNLDYAGKAIHCPVMSFGQNSIVFHQQFTHPTFAGYTIRTEGAQRIRGVISYVNEAEDFNPRFLELYRIRFGTESTFDESGAVRNYPLVDENDGLINIPFVEAKLDENCKLAHTHNIGVVTDNDNIILNGNYGNYNNLIRDLNDPELKVYVTQGIWQVFGHSDKKLRPGDLSYEQGIVTFNHSTRKLTITHPNPVDNIALVIGNDIILALNGIDECYINFIKEREIKKFVYNIIDVEINATWNIDIQPSMTHKYLKLLQVSINAQWPIELQPNITAEYAGKLYLSEINAQWGIELQPNITTTYLKAEFEYLGTTTVDFDFTENYIVQGTSSLDCPSSAQVVNWFNANYNASNYQIGDVIRVRTFVEDNGFPIAECNTHYFEVIFND
jgi:hypothetical protein